MYWIGIALLLVALFFAAVGVFIRRFSDGPVGPIPGGQLRSGTLESAAQVDWSFAKDIQLAQLQLEDPLTSRTTGILVHEGDLYVPCDLGFVWRRASPPAKWLMALVCRVKRWHNDALRDGRVVIRIRGSRYARQAVRETDPQRLEALNAAVEERAKTFLSSPLKETPRDPTGIWHFRLDPRPLLK